MAFLIDSDRYEEIRAVLDHSLDGNNLPDKLIEKDIYLGKADRFVRSKVTAANLEKPQTKLAVIYFAAALIAPSVPTLLSEKSSTGEQYSRKGFDSEARAAELFGLADAEIAEIEITTTDDEMPTMFTLASGRRGF